MSKLVCTKNFYMENGQLAFKEGSEYEITYTDQSGEPWAFMVDSEASEDHLMPWDDEVKEHFHRVICPKERE